MVSQAWFLLFKRIWNHFATHTWSSITRRSHHTLRRVGWCLLRWSHCQEWSTWLWDLLSTTTDRFNNFL